MQLQLSVKHTKVQLLQSQMQELQVELDRLKQVGDQSVHNISSISQSNANELESKV